MVQFGAEATAAANDMIAALTDETNPVVHPTHSGHKWEYQLFSKS